jgi:hypothetical protein
VRHTASSPACCEAAVCGWCATLFPLLRVVRLLSVAGVSLLPLLRIVRLMSVAGVSLLPLLRNEMLPSVAAA